MTHSDPGRGWVSRGTARLKRQFVIPPRRLFNNQRISAKAREITAQFPPAGETAPVVFFRASSGIMDLSYNNAFHILAAWGLGLQRIPVIHFACNAGMTRCILGTSETRPDQKPPCASCVRHSRALLQGSPAHWFGYQDDEKLREQLSRMSVAELENFQLEHEDSRLPSPIPLGGLVLPGIRWRMRRHHLIDDDGTRLIFSEFILSAWNVAREFAAFLDQVAPQAVVLFNGQFFPEATARWVALQRGIRVITHEVGLQPFSAYFTEGQATAYPIHIPDEFRLSPGQDAQLDEYLSKRFQGNFSMAGIRFWPEMKGLDESLLQRLNEFDQVVPVFTNVVFDTSQPHANTVFTDMFAWLDSVQQLAVDFPRTLFIIRAHPDEERAGKASRETVEDWVEQSGVARLPNVLFVAPGESLSSYELIRRSKFVMIYNSTIGLEATILGTPVLSAGRARFTQYPTVFFPASLEEYDQQAREFLGAEQIQLPEEFPQNARRFLYYQLFKTSLPFDRFLRRGYAASFTRFAEFRREDLDPENSPAMKAILDGIVNQGDFLLP